LASGGLGLVELLLKLLDARLGGSQSLLLQQGFLHQQVKRVGLLGGGPGDEPVGFGVLGHAADALQLVKELGQQVLFFAVHVGPE